MTEENPWYDEKAPAEVTLKALNQVCQEYKQVREEKEQVAKELKEVNAKLGKLELKLVEILTENQMKNYATEFGKFSVVNRVSVKQPTTPEEKMKFYNWLKEKGDFYNLISVNSRTLTSYVKKEIEIHKQEGDYGFVPPGLSEPETSQTISLRKA